jgi:acyl-CoA hydrolase
MRGHRQVQLLYQLAEAQVMREASAAAAREAAAIPRSAKEPSTTPPAGLLPGVPMASTSQRTLVLMHRQDRNSAAHIFGGHLLRSASELAYCTAVLHAGRHCEALAMSDVSFSAPVPIGCLVEFNATVSARRTCAESGAA